MLKSPWISDLLVSDYIKQLSESTARNLSMVWQKLANLASVERGHIAMSAKYFSQILFLNVTMLIGNFWNLSFELEGVAFFNCFSENVVDRMFVNLVFKLDVLSGFTSKVVVFQSRREVPVPFDAVSKHWHEVIFLDKVAPIEAVVRVQKDL